MGKFDLLISDIPNTERLNTIEESKPLPDTTLQQISVIDACEFTQENNQNGPAKQAEQTDTIHVKPTKKSEPETTGNILEGLVSGDNWFEVTYQGGEVRYIRYSTQDQLQEYYKRLNKHYKQALPKVIKAINYNEENNHISYIN
jgi:hypothetical protein